MCGGVSPGCYVLGFGSVGKLLPVLVSEADKSGRGFAILIMKLASCRCGRDFASLSMSKAELTVAHTN